MTITFEHLREILSYDPETGIFRWIKARGPRSAGAVAGWVKPGAGYIYIRLGTRNYPAHRLAFLYMEGCLPSHTVDHRNGIRDDNRWKNLRHATAAENARNKSVSAANKSGYIGVCKPAGRNKWRAQIGANGRNIRLGCFDTREEAARAYEEASRKLHGEFSRYARG